MNLVAPISTLMTTNLITVTPDDSLETVKKCLEDNNIHHIPVVHYTSIVGIISSTDFKNFMRGFSRNEEDSLLENVRLRAWRAEDIMTKKLAKVDSKDTIATVLEVFKTNRIHALPVVDEGELVGIVTTYDVISALAAEPIRLEDYQKK